MKTFLKFILVAGMFVFVSPAKAQLHIGIGIRFGPPPPPREEIVVARPYPDAVWIAGYYRWHPKHHRYVWVHGYWGRPPHPHYMWVPGRWEHRHNEWVYNEGRWDGHDQRHEEHGRVRTHGDHR